MFTIHLSFSRLRSLVRSGWSVLFIGLVLAFAPVHGQDGYQPDRFPPFERLSETAEVSGSWSVLNPVDFEAPEVLLPDFPISEGRMLAHGVPLRLASGAEVAGTGVESDGQIRVGLPSEAQEVFALVWAEVPKRMIIHQGKGSMYHWRLSEPSFFEFQIVYADGTRDGIIPYNLDIEDYGLFPGTQVVALPVDPDKTPVELVFEDRMANSAFGIAAVTANTGAPQTELPVFVQTLPEERTAGGGPARLDVAFDAEGGLRWGDLEVSGIGGGVSLDGPVFAFVADGTVYDSTDWAVTASRTTGSAREIDLELRREGLDLQATLRSTGEGDRMRFALDIENRDGSPVGDLDNEIRFPILGDLTIGSAEDTWYFFTANGGIISNREAHWDDDIKKGDHEIWEYSDRKPFQFDGFFNPQLGGGLTVYTDDQVPMPKKYELTKDHEKGVGYAVVYRYTKLDPGENWSSPPTFLQARKGGWRAQFADLRARIEQPEKAYGNARFNHIFSTGNPPIWTTNFRKDVLEQADRYFGVNHVHLFGWSFHPHEDPTPEEKAGERVAGWKWKQWGYYGDFSKFGGPDGFKRDVVDFIRDTYGAGISYYTDPYLYDTDWDGELERFYRRLPAERQAAILARYNRQFGASADAMNEARLVELWAARDANGTVETGYNSVVFCIAQPGARDYMLEQVRLAAEKIDNPTAIYIDEANRITNLCLAENHEHRHGAFLEAYHDFAKRVRDIVPPSVALFTEYVPTDVIGRYQQGALGHVPEIAWSKWPSSVRSKYEASAPHFVDLPRFAMPWLKMFHIHKNRVLSNGNWFPFRYAFFNGNGFYGRGFGGKMSDGHVDPGAVDFIGNSLRVQRAHPAVFASHDVEPLVPTGQDLVFANRFRAGGTTAWTLFNADYVTRRGTALKVPHVEGAVYYDAWHDDAPLEPEVRDGYAYLETEIGPRGVGCLVQRTP